MASYKEPFRPLINYAKNVLTGQSTVMLSYNETEQRFDFRAWDDNNCGFTVRFEEGAPYINFTEDDFEPLE